MTRSLLVIILAGSAVLAVAGCSNLSRDQALSERSMETVYNEVDTMSVDGLQKRALAYRDAVVHQKKILADLRSDKEKLSFSESTGPRADALNRRVTDVSRVLSRLMERHQAYFERLREKGVAVDEYKY
jgi:hypothetical protein